MKNFIYYGLTKEEYNSCRDNIIDDNRQALISFGRITAIVGIILLFLAVFVKPSPAVVPIYTFIIFFYGTIWLTARIRKGSNTINILTYLTLIATYFICIYIATCVAIPTENGVTALIVFTICGIVAIVRLDIYLVILSVSYVFFFVLEWTHKTDFVATADTINGFIFSLIGIVLNYKITTLKLNSYLDEKRLSYENEQLHEIIENIPGGFGIFRLENKQLIPTIINSGISKIYGLDKNIMMELTQSGIRKFIHEDDYHTCIKAINNAIYDTGVFNIIYRLPKSLKKEDFYIHAQGQIFIKNNSTKIVYINFTDISEQILLEKNKRENAAKSDFLSKMSHDLRTPMNVIIGMSSLALESKDNPDKLEDYLRKINSASHYLLGLVNDVLDTSKIESNKLFLSEEPYPYEEFIDDITTMIEPLCQKKNIQFVYRKKTTGCTILTDKVRLRQIYFNLLSNAVKFTPENGRVEFRIENIHITENSFSSDNYVIDNGVGMSKEFQEHMFEPFVQENSNSTINPQGTGLGLAIVHSLVSLMGGTISVQSSPGNGTSIKVHLEFKRAKLETAAAQIISDSIDLTGKRILLAEDNALNTEIVHAILKKFGLDVSCAANGKIAVDMFSASENGYYDAILMDIMMPEMNGYEAARTIRSLDRSDSKTVPIIALSANAFSEDIEKSKRMGMNDHLIKPINPKLLMKSLRSVLSD